jgi:hypothetical protein
VPFGRSEEAKPTTTTIADYAYAYDGETPTTTVTIDNRPSMIVMGIVDSESES